MLNAVRNDKKKFLWVLSILLLSAFTLTSGISYQVAQNSLRQQIENNALPLTSDNIYSEIQQDLFRPKFISSLMAQDTFVREWTLNKERDPEKLIRYLRAIQDRYDTVTSFFVSEASRNYYHASGVLKQIADLASQDAWYFRVRSLPDNEQYEINVDTDTADRSKTIVFVNHKVFDFEGQFVGVTGVGLAVEKVRSLIAVYQQRYNRRIFFTDREGNITLSGAKFNGGVSLQQTPGLDSLATRILTSQSGSFQYQHYGKTVYLNSRYVPEFKWYLIVEQQETAGEQALLNSFWINVGLSVLVTLGLVFIANLVLGRYQRNLETMASTDKLTGVANRQLFEQYLGEQAVTANQRDVKLSLILLDIDYFKVVNESYGHGIGDLVLKTVANHLRNSLAENEMICRWGGEEFILLLPNRDLVSSAEMAETLRLALAERELRVNGQHIAISVSCGVAQFHVGESIEDFIRRADVALYQAKAQGRNRVVLNH